MPNIGPTELIIVLVIVLLIFGPKRLPGLGKQLGSGMREFKESITGSKDDEDDDDDKHDDATVRRTPRWADRTRIAAPLEGEVVSERTRALAPPAASAMATHCGRSRTTTA